MADRRLSPTQRSPRPERRHTPLLSGSCEKRVNEKERERDGGRERPGNHMVNDGRHQRLGGDPAPPISPVPPELFTRQSLINNILLNLSGRADVG